MYAGDEYGQLVDWCIDLMNAAGEGLPERAIRHLEDVFITSSRYELAFWEMAWTHAEVVIGTRSGSDALQSVRRC